MTEYSSDKPISNKNNDKFNREPFAEKVAFQLKSMSVLDSYVIGLYAKWGSGKSSTIDLIKGNLGDSVIVVDYNPWVYSNQKSMVKGLIVQLAAEIDKYLPKPSEEKMSLKAKSLSRFPWLKKKYDEKTVYGALPSRYAIGDLLGELAELTGAVNDSVGKGAQAVSNLLGKESKQQLTAEVEKRIKETNKRVVVIIDDVDRLDPNELFELFKLIKVVTDFKGVTYLVAFDDIQVSSALNKRFSNSDDKNAGRRYIEKIIQIPINLPAIDLNKLNEILIEKVESLLEDNNILVSEDDSRIFSQIVDESISKVIRTPRDMNRYINSLKFTLPIIKNEVNAVDHMIMEVVRIFYPSTYLELIKVKSLLVHAKDYGKDDSSRSLDQKRIRSLPNYDDSSEALIQALFPSIKKLFSPYTSIPDEGTFSKMKYIASPDYFDRYFALGVNTDDVSDMSILKIATNKSPGKMKKDLTSLINPKNKKLVHRKLTMYKDVVEDPIALVEALIHAESKILDEKIYSFFDSPHRNLVNTIFEIMNPVHGTVENYIKLLYLINDLEILTNFINEIVSDNPTYKKLSHNNVETFKQEVAKRLRQLSQERIFFTRADGFAHHLYSYWAEFGSRLETNEYLLSKLTNTNEIIDFLTCHLTIWTGSSGAHRGDFDNAVYMSIDKVVDTQRLYEIIKKENPELTSITEFPRLERSADDTGRVGNEKSRAFKRILMQQFILISANRPSS